MTMKKIVLLIVSAIAGAVLSADLSAEVRMSALFTDNMVLQQKVFAPVWGFAVIRFANPTAWVAACILLLPAYFTVMKKVRKKLQAHG